MVTQCWTIVCDAGPTLSHHWFSGRVGGGGRCKGRSGQSRPTRSLPAEWWHHHCKNGSRINLYRQLHDWLTFPRRRRCLSLCFIIIIRYVKSRSPRWKVTIKWQKIEGNVRKRKQHPRKDKTNSSLCWYNVDDTRPTLNHHWFNVLC